MTTSRQPAPAFGQFIQGASQQGGGFDPFGGLVQGINLGIGLENLEIARQQRAQMMFEAQKAEEQRRMVQDLQAQYVKNPTLGTLNALIPFIDPKMSAEMREIIEAQGKDQARRQFQLLAPVAFALQGGKTDAAVQQIDRMIEGTQDPQQRRGYEAMRDIARENPQFFIAQAAYAAQLGGFPELAKTFLEKGKPGADKFRVLTPEELKTMVPGATGVWGIDEKGKPVQIFAPQEGFTVVPQAELAGLGITTEPGKVVVQRNNKTGELKITNLGPLATATATAETKLPPPEKALLKIDEDAVAQFVGNAGVASNFARDAAAIEQLLRGKGGGAVVSLTTRLKEFAGIQDDTVTAQTLARSLQTRGATQLRAPGSGSTTDFEMRAFLDSFPQLTQTENGRALLAKYSTRFAERQRKLADHARNLLRENKYSLQEMARFDNDLGEILGDDIKELIGARPGAVPRYTGPAAPSAPAPAPPPAARGQPAAAPQQRRNVIVNY